MTTFAGEPYPYTAGHAAPYKFLSLLILLLLITFAGVPSAIAAPGRLVRVGWFPQPGYMERDGDSFYGYNYDYLRRIARYTGWRYEFVEGSFTGLYEALKKGDIDILGSVFYSRERAAKVAFPNLDVGFDYLSMFTTVDSPLAENDFPEFNGLRVGFDSEYNCERLLDFAAKNGIAVYPVKYRTPEAIRKGLLKGEIDAGLVGGFRNDGRFRALCRFSPQPFYFVTSHGKRNVLADLEQALMQIKIQNPFYEKELSAKNIPSSNRYITFTREEREYIKNAGVIKVAYDPSWMPYEFTDKSGRYNGITADVFHRISAITGLQFAYHPNGSAEGRGADLISCFDHDYDEAEKRRLLLTDIYMSVPLMLVRRSDKVFDSTGDTVTAVPRWLSSPANRLVKEGYSFRYYETAAQCCDEVKRDNDVDQALLSSFTAELLLDDTKYAGLVGVALQGYSLNACIALTNADDFVLNNILNKAILYISDQEIDNIVIKHVLENKEINIGAIIKKMPLDVLLLFMFVLVVLVVALTFAFITKSRSMKRVKALLYQDQLTGALSQAGFELSAKNKIAGAREDMYVIDFDIYKFQIYNEIFSRESGDLLLREIAGAYRRYFTDKRDLLARVYADHFVALAFSESLDELKTRISRMSDDIKLMLKEQSIIVNYGIYRISDREIPVDIMMNYAAAAKWTVKGNSEKYIGVFDGRIYKKSLENSELISSFDGAAERGEFIPYIQAKYDGVSEKISGGEALVRWVCPDGRIIPPSRFIGLFEKSGQILRLDFIILEQVCRILRQIIDGGRKAVPISVNFSRLHLHDGDFLAKVKAMTAKYEVPNGLIEIECTESIVTEDMETILPVFAELRRAGFSIAMDDFGSGYSSLNTLISIPMDVIKLDRGFLLQRETDRLRSEEVIETVIALAHKLSFKVVAEGVESRDQLDFLRQAGCDTIQGYYYARPAPPEEFIRML
ncbi:MAG: EAL domain-containing protein [bacterium]|nr:EAL domain-containing protein [bacterium]